MQKLNLLPTFGTEEIDYSRSCVAASSIKQNHLERSYGVDRAIESHPEGLVHSWLAATGSGR
jgi:hypothetical protein